MNIQTKLTAVILRKTGTRFPKSGTFGRDGLARRVIRALGVNPIAANLLAFEAEQARTVNKPGRKMFYTP